jgi:hypothetical protein
LHLLGYTGMQPHVFVFKVEDCAKQEVSMSRRAKREACQKTELVSSLGASVQMFKTPTISTGKQASINDPHLNL